jgi:type VI protein secretion system component VasK
MTLLIGSRLVRAFVCTVAYVLYLLFGSVLNVAIAVAVVLAGIALIIGGRVLLARSSVRSNKKEQEKRVKDREKRVKEREENEARLSRDLELLACSNNQSHEVKLSALPKEKRTVSLRLADTKAKVCRPFAQ